MRRRRERHDGRPLRLLAGLYGAVSAGTVAYWAAFFGGPARIDQSERYLDFERSFLLADAYLAAMSAAAAGACWRREPRALALGLMASSASIYLGCMDVFYNLRHGKYRDLRGAMAVEVAINAYSLALSPLAARRLWRERDKLAPSPTWWPGT
jgi:hypothetical protein